jgi:hypothetical protein
MEEEGGDEKGQGGNLQEMASLGGRMLLKRRRWYPWCRG